MGALTCINDYLKIYGAELGHRVVDQFPPLHQPSDLVWPVGSRSWKARRATSECSVIAARR